MPAGFTMDGDAGNVYAAAGTEQAEEESTQKLSDLMEVQVDGNEKTVLQLYQNGVYETKLNLDAGNHTIQIQKNNSTYGTAKTITTTNESTVYVRVKAGVITDSVNNPEEFHTAAIVGDFSGLSFYNEDGTEYAIGKWDPKDANGALTYTSGGIFQRTFYFKELDEDVTLEDGGYKVALDGSWDISYGNGSSNIALTIPKGTSELTVFVDTLSGIVYDSVRSGTFEVTQNSGNVTYPSFDYTVSLIGSVRGDESINWNAAAQGYEFTQLSDSLYLYQKTFAAGTYQYKTVINYTSWYEKTDGNKVFTLTDMQNVVFLYDAADESLYDSVNDANTIAVRLGMEEEAATSKVQNNANGTTTFITTLADENDTVQLVYAPKEDALNTTTLTLTKGTDSSGKYNGTYVSDSIYFGDVAVDYVYYYLINGTRILDDSAEVVTVDDVVYSHYTRDAFTGRLVTVPGTFPGVSWDAASNVMTYQGNGLYSYTFKDVPAANYEFKIATGTWSENYGVDGIADGSNYAVTVTEKQDVTVYYSDLNTHRAVTSLIYEFATVSLTGTSEDSTISINTELTDPGLTGIYKVTVPMAQGTYSNLTMTYKDKSLPIDRIELTEAKEVTFYFDPSTEIYYNDSTKKETQSELVKFDSKDTSYKSVYGAVEENEKVSFSIDTGMDVTKAMLVVKGKELQNVTMTPSEKDGTQTWSADVTFDTYGQYTYFFALYFGSYVQIYCDDDGYYGTGKLTDLSDLKAYDLIVYKAGYETPDWMKNAVIYQIFPDRFFNGDSSNDTAQTTARGATDYEFIKDWYAYPENPDQEKNNASVYPSNACKGDGIWNNEIYGGDLEGITERIDYLKALGVNVIYLNPVFSSISSHRYDTSDYETIDPVLGDLGDFKELVAAAEENDMHIVLDGVFNHVSDDSIYFDRYYKFIGKDGKVGAYPYWAYVYDYMNENTGVTVEQAKAKAKTYFKGLGVTDFSYTEWFQINNTSLLDENGVAVADTIGERKGLPVYGYEGWWGYDSMPVIMSTDGSEYQTGDWAQEIIEGSSSVGQYWLRQGSNGWRLDVANEVSDETWQHFRQSVKSLNSDAVIIGEIWDDATEYILGDMYDSVMNYVFRDAVLAYAKGGTSSEAVKTLEKMRERYPEEAFYAMMNLVGSHDTTRLLSYLDGIEDDRKQTDIESAFPSYDKTSATAKQRQYLVALIQMTYAGAPTIYYGDELGMTGADDPDNRRAMAWGTGSQDLVEWYAKLANIRSKYTALRTGTVTPVTISNKSGAAEDSLMAYVRKDTEDSLLVITNNAAQAKTVTFKVPEELQLSGSTLTDLVNGASYSVIDGAVTVTVSAYRGVILTEHVKELTVNYGALKPAYDSAYVVEVNEPETSETPVTSSTPVVSETPVTSAAPSVSEEPEESVKPSQKPVKKKQQIIVSRSSYQKTLGSKAFFIKARTSGNGKISYTSSDTSVATVSDKGKVTIRGIGKAKITVTAAETKKYRKATKTITVTVSPERIGCKISKKYSKKKYSLLVNWKASQKVTGYEVEYSKSRSFKSNAKSVTVKGRGESSISISGVKKESTYYVRIRVYKEVDGVKYYSGYSNVRKIRI